MDQGPTGGTNRGDGSPSGRDRPSAGAGDDGDDGDDGDGYRAGAGADDGDGTGDGTEGRTDGSPLGRLGRRQVSGWYLFAGLVAIAVVCSFRVDSGKGVMLVGPVPGIELEGLGPGSYRFTTVEVRPVTVAGYLWARVRGDQVVDLTGGRGERQQSALASMELSQQTAWAVANSLADGGDGTVPVVAEVTSVVDDSPAQAAGLGPGDEILSVDGVPLSSAGELPGRVGASGGEELVLEVARDGAVRDVWVTPERDGSTWRLGVEVAPRPRSPDEDRPVIDAGGVGGSSAGLLFTLGYVDAITDGDLAGGKLVSGTGTIDADGSVGRIDGVALKVEGALAAGADVFLVPESIHPLAEAAANGRIQVVPVASVRDAVDWLCGHGGSSTACG